MNVWSGLRVDASGDHQRRERVAAFVEGHGFEPACSPGALGALRDGRRAERCAVGEAEHQRTLVLVLCDPMLDEVIAEYRRDRRAAKAGRRLRLDRALLLIPRALDADQAGCEVDAVPGERLQLATPQAGVEGGGPERAIFGRRVVDERQGLNRGRDPGAAATPSPPALTPLQPECSSPVPAPAPGSEGPAAVTTSAEPDYPNATCGGRVVRLGCPPSGRANPPCFGGWGGHGYSPKYSPSMNSSASTSANSPLALVPPVSCAADPFLDRDPVSRLGICGVKSGRSCVVLLSGRRATAASCSLRCWVVSLSACCADPDPAIRRRVASRAQLDAGASWTFGAPQAACAAHVQPWSSRSCSRRSSEAGVAPRSSRSR